MCALLLSLLPQPPGAAVGDCRVLGSVAVITEDSSRDGAVVVSAMLPKLAAVGRAFTSIAIPQACNNPGCGNLRGLREKSLVCGSSCVCSR